MADLVDRIRRRQTAISVSFLALLAYLPALSAAPGRMPTDSKLYVYLDPGRFIADTTTTFDARQFAGWVPHQHIAYLWPTGPWYWVFDQMGAPDWIAHRLWIGTLLFAAGLGARWMTRVLGFAPLAALAAAFVYQLSPYILPYISRTSVLLLPFAGLGWIVGCTIRATDRGRWRYPAAIALVVLTVGAVNATALAMVIPAPVLWLVHAGWSRRATWRRVAATAGKVAVLSTAVSLWWMTMLVIQGRHGADVLAYSESLESVSFTSTSTEVARGLGYWLFYVRDAFAATTTASIDHLVSARVVLAGFVLLAVCLAGVVFVRSPHRRFAGLLVGAGVILGVGVHPIDDPSPFMDALVGDSQSGLALALRSSTRAVPVLLLGLSIGAASLVSSSGGLLRRLRPTVPQAAVRVSVAGVVVVLAIVNLPALRNGGFVDPALERDQSPPAHWLAATEALDERPDGYRVLQVPGTEFGAFEWGFTVDQPLPGLTERPLVTRDLLPLGSPAAMDLVFALDDRIQEGTLDVAAVAPIARLLGVDTIWVSGDVAFGRFGSARPEVVTAELTGRDAVLGGLSGSTSYGTSAPVSPTIDVIDAESIADERVGEPIAPITLVDVDQPVPTVRVKDETVIVSGSGDGLVDAAAAGLLDGSEAVVYSADLDPNGVIQERASRLIVTDSNRDRAHHWRSSQDVVGYTESGLDTDGVLRFEAADQRLPIFGDDPEPATQTVSIQRGPVTAQASAYGEPFAYRPEHRAVMAIDGDPTTAWLVADRAPAVGEFIELQIAGELTHVDLLQPSTPDDHRRITEVAVSVDGVAVASATLDERSFSGTGQRVDLDVAGRERSGDDWTVRVEITATSNPQPPIGDAIGSVGFAEVSTGNDPTVEWIRTPVDAVPPSSDLPVDVVLTRLRTEATDPWRDDPEPALRRIVALPESSGRDVDVTVRFDRRADGALLADLLGEPANADRHLTGAPRRRGAAALDGDSATAWVTPIDDVVGATLRVEGDGTASSIDVEQPVGSYSPIERLLVGDASGRFEVEVGDGSITLPRPVDLSTIEITVAGVAPALTIDRRYGEPFVLPAAISELRFDGESPTLRPLDAIAADCRTDLLRIDGTPVGLSFEASIDDLLDGAAIDAEVCDAPPGLVAAGTLEIESTPGARTGFHVDRVVITESSERSTSDPADETGIADADDIDGATAGLSGVDPSEPVLVDEARRSRTIEVPPCPDGCWVIVGEGFNDAWSATADNGSLGDPVPIDGNANGWWIEPTTAPTMVVAEWTAQGPLNVAFGLSLLAVLVSIALVVADRRRDDDPADVVSVAEVAGASRRAPTRSVVAVGLVTAIGAAVFIDLGWGLAAAAVCAAAIGVQRPRMIGWLGWGIVFGAGLVVTAVVRDERPFPNAGWPVRFEWLHGWTLFGVVLIAGASLLPSSPAVDRQHEDPGDTDGTDVDTGSDTDAPAGGDRA